MPSSTHQDNPNFLQAHPPDTVISDQYGIIHFSLEESAPESRLSKTNGRPPSTFYVGLFSGLEGDFLVGHGTLVQ